MDKRIYAIRGAIDAQNTKDSILLAVKKLTTELYTKNNIIESDIISIQFTMTKDLTELNPAAALRQAGYGKSTALFCSVEPEITNSLTSIIRVLVTTYLDKKPIHCYLGSTRELRPDFLPNQ
ncbi:MAG TPA: chorismate mutase [Treponemataceae bacterium]|nr:chorismate mutase [Treponemataceae bacterium]